jgi:predicted ATPase
MIESRHLEEKSELDIMKIKVLPRRATDSNPEPKTVYLEIDHWNDYSFVTQFLLQYRDATGNLKKLGTIKIGFKGQTTEISTYSTLASEFSALDDNYFALGQDIDFYRNIAKLPDGVGEKILLALQDIVLRPETIDEIQNERVFSASLLRDVSLSLVKGQFFRALLGAAERTNFDFAFVRPASDKFGGMALEFQVNVKSIPNSNIHAVIGRNGVGKTTLLNGMIDAITKRPHPCKFIAREDENEVEIGVDYFSSLVSVSFSAFDPFNPPDDQPNPAKGTCYFYIGLKDAKNPDQHRTISELRAECVKSLAGCFRHDAKSKRWLSAIEKLGSDENFAAMKLSRLQAAYQNVRETLKSTQSDSEGFLAKYAKEIDKYLSRMSSGHAVVLLTVTRLVDTVQEKTLVLLDEPESHLHPPLLSAFVRALSDLLHDQNGVAIIATHSPVVLQEIPRSCVWKLYRVGTQVSIERPTIETFAENVGRLTSEVFSLEVERSGFHALLEASVGRGETFDGIVGQYRNQLGFEGRAILVALIAARDGAGGK